MMHKTFLCGLFLLLVTPVAAGAQVIQIDDSGQATTFDQPTVFTDERPSPIRAAESRDGSVAGQHLVLAEAARVHGLDPQLLEAVAWQESRGQMTAISLKGARGVMQLMPGTAADLGVKIDDAVDNIRGGALYLRQQIDRFGSIPLALAAYNAGPGAVLRYGGIPPYSETRNYVSRIMERWRSATPRAIPSEPSQEVQQP